VVGETRWVALVGWRTVLECGPHQGDPPGLPYGSFILELSYYG
jgi:hypothetical protein